MQIPKTQSKRELIRVGKHLSEVISIKDAAGNLLHRVVKPVMIELYPRDVMQQVVGATLLAVPISYTQEVWDLGTQLPMDRAIMIMVLSIFFVGLFIYYNFYRNHFATHWTDCIKRIVTTYIITFVVCFMFLYLIEKAAFGPDLLIGIKRTILVALPASMSAAVADMIK